MDWTSIRAQFDLDPSYLHFALGMLTAHPRIVRAGIEQHRKGLDSNPFLYHQNKEQFESIVLEKAASYLGTISRKIAITESTTMGLAVVLGGIKLCENDEIIATIHEHYTALESLRHNAKKTTPSTD